MHTGTCTRSEAGRRTSARRLCGAAIAACLLLSSAAWSASAIYRWVEAGGEVHFGSNPPPGVDAQRLDASGKVQPKPQGSFYAPVFETADTAQPSGTDATEDDNPAPQARPEPELTAEQQAREAQLRAEAQSRLAQIEATKQDNCRKARDQFEQFTTYARIRISDGQGGERPITEEERQDRIEQAQLAIVQNCEDQG